MTVLKDLADPSFLDKLDDYRQKNPNTMWIYDPEVEGVVALVEKGTRNAVVIVYVDDEDFEVDDWKL